jgi:hypothetical protein
MAIRPTATRASVRSGVQAARDLGYTGDELQGQYRLPDGTQCMKLVQIANEGGLLPKPVVRDSSMFAWQIVP